jgi:hypothetical protein
MQKELHRYRKTLTAAERDLEIYRQQIAEMQEKIKREHADAGQLEELERLHRELDNKDAEVLELRRQLETGAKGGDVDKLRNDMDDLEMDLREKERLLESRDDEIVSKMF